MLRWHVVPFYLYLSTSHALTARALSQRIGTLACCTGAPACSVPLCSAVRCCAVPCSCASAPLACLEKQNHERPPPPWGPTEVGGAARGAHGAAESHGCGTAPAMAGCGDGCGVCCRGVMPGSMVVMKGLWVVMVGVGLGRG